jgi:hypothetical protein
MEGNEIVLALRRLVVNWMSSNVGSCYIFGRTELGKPLMISSTVSALCGTIVFVVLFVCEGRRLLDDGKSKKLTKSDDLH